MYIGRIEVLNYRCFRNLCVSFQPGINIIIGENNAGKTALLKALGLIFDRNTRKRLELFDFYQGIDNYTVPPAITVSAVLISSEFDTLSDKALVATWLTKLDEPWEATLTYQFFLPEEELPKFKNDLGAGANDASFWEIVERYLPKYISRIYGGSPEAKIKADPGAIQNETSNHETA